MSSPSPTGSFEQVAPALIASGSVMAVVLVGLCIIILKKPTECVCRILSCISTIICLSLIAVIVLIVLYAKGDITIPAELEEVAEDYVKSFGSSG